MPVPGERRRVVNGFELDGTENPKDDPGTRQGFWKRDCNDAKWPDQFVPWDWNQPFPPGSSEKRYEYGGGGWYRRHVVIPEAFGGSRIILHFEFVERESVVYVNGQEVGRYSMLVNHHRGWRGRGRNVEDFEFDITEAARPGEDNVIAVRVYSDGLRTWRYKWGYKTGSGGIQQPCWIEARELIAAPRILVTPHLEQSAIEVAVRFESTLPEEQSIDLELGVYPWESRRYTPPGSAASSQAAFPATAIRPGTSWHRFTVKLDNPATWNPDRPFLYGVRVRGKGGALGADARLLGAERFGFREVTIKGDQFYLNGERLYLRGILLYEPYRSNVLACGGKYGGQKFGMVAGEVKLGKGLFLFSQLNAVRRYGKDSAATIYLENLVAYTCGRGAWTGEHAVTLLGTKPETAIKPPARDRTYFVDLRPHCNMGFRDEVADDKKGGWTDQGTKDLREFPTGRANLLGVPFDIIDPKMNGGRSCIVLAGKAKPHFPAAVERIRIEAAAKRLFFLVSAAWGSSVKSGEAMGVFAFTYEEGGAGISSDTKLMLVRDRNITDWTRPKPLPSAVAAWSTTGTEEGGKQYSKTAYLIEWTNPYQAEDIRWMDFSSAGKSIPILIAVTGEK